MAVEISCGVPTSALVGGGFGSRNQRTEFPAPQALPSHFSAHDGISMIRASPFRLVLQFFPPSTTNWARLRNSPQHNGVDTDTGSAAPRVVPPAHGPHREPAALGPGP